MKTRVALLALMMTAGGLFIQPFTAAAADFKHDQHARVEERTDIRIVRQYETPVYRAPIVHRGDHRRDRNDRWSARDRR